MTFETKNNKKNSYTKGFSKIDRVLKSTAKQYKLEDVLNKHQAIKYWQQVASGFIDNAEKLTKAMDFKKGVLVVACLTSEIAYQIKLMSEKIISALNEVLGRKVIYAIYLEK